MNKMLVAVFDNQTAAELGLQALRRLHAAGDITLYATSVMAKDATGHVSVMKAVDEGAHNTATGLAVGSLIGLLGGPAGVLVGAATGTVAGAVRDYWMAGVGLDFVEEAQAFLKPGKVGLVAEIEEEWVIPVDSALDAVGGHVTRRSRSALAEAQFDHDIAAFKSEIDELQAEAAQATGLAKAKLHTKLDKAKASLDGAVHRAQQRLDALGQEADAKADSLKAQLGQAKDNVKGKVEERVKRVNASYHARGAKLSQAWALTKQALAP